MKTQVLYSYIIILSIISIKFLFSLTKLQNARLMHHGFFFSVLHDMV